MNPGIVLLVLGYVLSQFFRAFLAVLATPIKTDIGISPEILANASGLWFLAFAAMQIPIGWSLDTIGPRRTAASLFLIGAAGGVSNFRCCHISVPNQHGNAIDWRRLFTSADGILLYFC